MNNNGTEESIWFSDDPVNLPTKIFLGVVLFLLFCVYGIPKMVLRMLKNDN